MDFIAWDCISGLLSNVQYTGQQYYCGDFQAQCSNCLDIGIRFQASQMTESVNKNYFSFSVDVIVSSYCIFGMVGRADVV